MKIKKIISDVTIGQIHIFDDLTSNKIIYDDLTDENKLIISKYNELCDKKFRESKPLIEEPSDVDEPIYILQTPCPKDNSLIAKVYDINYSNDKINKIIRIDVRIIHYNQNSERVPIWDTDTYIICDMTEDRMVMIPESGSPGIKEYSYVLAETLLHNGMSIKQLISSAIQLAEIETNSEFLKRIYGE